jgi:uncharacterized protein (DUF983 family)
MVTYEVERPDGEERGIRIACPDHGESEEFQPGYRRVSFYCPGCEFELTVELDDPHDPRDLGELC